MGCDIDVVRLWTLCFGVMADIMACARSGGMDELRGWRCCDRGVRPEPVADV